MDGSGGARSAGAAAVVVAVLALAGSVVPLLTRAHAPVVRVLTVVVAVAATAIAIRAARLVDREDRSGPVDTVRPVTLADPVDAVVGASLTPPDRPPDPTLGSCDTGAWETRHRVLLGYARALPDGEGAAGSSAPPRSPATAVHADLRSGVAVVGVGVAARAVYRGILIQVLDAAAAVPREVEVRAVGDDVVAAHAAASPRPASVSDPVVSDVRQGVAVAVVHGRSCRGDQRPRDAGRSTMPVGAAVAHGPGVPDGPVAPAAQRRADGPAVPVGWVLLVPTTGDVPQAVRTVVRVDARGCSLRRGGAVRPDRVATDGVVGLVPVLPPAPAGSFEDAEVSEDPGTGTGTPRRGAVPPGPSVVVVSASGRDRRAPGPPVPRPRRSSGRWPR